VVFRALRWLFFFREVRSFSRI